MDEHLRFGKKGVGEHEWRVSWYWQRLCDGAGDGIEKVLYVDNVISLALSIRNGAGGSLGDNCSSLSSWEVSKEGQVEMSSDYSRKEEVVSKKKGEVLKCRGWAFNGRFWADECE